MKVPATAPSPVSGGAPTLPVDVIAELTLAAFKDAPWYGKIIMLLPVVGGVLGFALCFVVENEFLRFGFGVGALASVSLPFWRGIKITVPGAGGLPEREGASSGRLKWSRLVPRDIPEADLADLRQRLETLRDKAALFIKDQIGRSEISLNDVRANIFLPDTSALSSTGLCELHIHQGLHVGMDPDGDEDAIRAEGERSIRFWPGQGLTGVVFTKHEPEGLSSTVTEDGPAWPPEYLLTDPQRGVIHPQLRWIASFPLIKWDGGGGQAMGVLNIDGLRHALDEGEINALVAHLADKMLPLSGKLAEAIDARISVYLEDYN